MKEEAVITMIRADVYGKKTMLSTSALGSSRISELLNGMQHEWTAFLASLTDIRAQLEAALMKWGDITTSASQVRLWMKSVKKRLDEKEELSTLSDKKFNLQRSQVSYIDQILN